MIREIGKMVRQVVIATLFIIGLMMVVKFISTFPKEDSLVSPNLVQIIAGKFTKPSPSPSPRLKTYHFDSTTDLKKELDSINPQILDSDFAE